MNNILVEIICEGLHWIQQPITSNEPPLQIPSITVLQGDAFTPKKQGWALTSDKRFSMDGSFVWLCPDCAKKLKETKQ